jgi:type IV pilus assembly protein PilO
MAVGNQLNASQPLEQMARLPRQLRYLILAGVFVAILCVYGFVFYRGVQQKVTNLDVKLTKVHSEIAESRAVESNLKSFEQQQQRLRAELADALRRLPNQKELPVLLTDLSSLGKKSGLEIRSFRPVSEIQHGFYAEVPIKIEFVGSYHEVALFFDRLSRLSRIVNISELTMSHEDADADPPQLEVRGIATTFRFIDESDTPAGGA